MSKQVTDLSPLTLARLLAASLPTLLLGACANNHPMHAANQKDAAAYNVQLGLDYLNQGDLQRAKDKLDKALTQNPDNPDVHSARATLFEAMHEIPKADDEFRTALRLAPKDPRIQNNYAVYLCQTGRTDEGVKTFMQAANNPLYATPEAAYTNAGVCLRAAKRDDEARAEFNAALQVRPNSGEAAYQLATLDFDHGQLTAARSRIDTYIGTYDATADLLLLGVRVARKQCDGLAAQRFARRLQLDYPGSDQARALATLDRITC
jgi:type IV pilus assembly protein PilF